MKNYEKANTPGFGEQISDCYIEDMEAILKTKLLILQIFKLHAKLIIVDDVLFTRSPDILVSLHKHAYDAEMWANFYCTVDKNEIDGKLKYEWTFDDPDDYRIIWFDHDLGDLVVDTCTQQQFDDWGLDESNRIGDNVYFYYIT